MIYYLGYYKSRYIDDYANSGSNAASFKMGYVVRSIKNLGKKVTVVSWCPSDKMGKIPLREIQVDDLQKEVYLPSVRINKMPMRFTAWFRNRDIYRYLSRNVKKEDTVIVYHASTIANSVLKAKKRIGFKLILEVEEIYHVDTQIKNAQKVKSQEEALLRAADSYIFVNDLIYDKYVNNGKPHMVLYGVYDTPQFDYQERLDGDTIRVLYSGSIEKVRGAELAIETAKYLPKNYRLHICGAGVAAYVEKLVQKIQSHNQSGKGCEIVYHGQLSESDLDALALSCDIGLNLQDIHNPFEAVSFPSKITFYFQHGLNVVSTKMTSVLGSTLAEFVEFGEDSAEEMAQRIIGARLRDKATNMRIMKDLDQEYRRNLKCLVD